MNIISKLMEKLRCGTATTDEIENLDRRLFCLGAAASAGSLIVRPTFVDMAAMVQVVPIEIVMAAPAGWSVMMQGTVTMGAAAWMVSRGKLKL